MKVAERGARASAGGPGSCVNALSNRKSPFTVSVLARSFRGMPLVAPPPPERVRILNDHPVPQHWEYRPRLRVRARVEYRIAGADRYAPAQGLVFVHLPDPRLATWGAWLSVDDIEVLEG